MTTTSAAPVTRFRRTVAAACCLFGVLGCQELPPGVLAGGDSGLVAELDSREESPRPTAAFEPMSRQQTHQRTRLVTENPALADIVRRLDRLEGLRVVPGPVEPGVSGLREQVAALTRELAESRRRLAMSERLLAEEFGRRSSTTKFAAGETTRAAR